MSLAQVLVLLLQRLQPAQPYTYSPLVKYHQCLHLGKIDQNAVEKHNTNQENTKANRFRFAHWTRFWGLHTLISLKLVRICIKFARFYSYALTPKFPTFSPWLHNLTTILLSHADASLAASFSASGWLVAWSESDCDVESTGRLVKWNAWVRQAGNLTTAQYCTAISSNRMAGTRILGPACKERCCSWQDFLYFLHLPTASFACYYRYLWTVYVCTSSIW